MFKPEDLFKIVSVEDFDVHNGRIAAVCYENQPVARILNGFGDDWLDSSEKINLGELFAESVRWSPEDQLLIEADRGGAERRSIYLYENGSLTPLLADGYDNVDYTPSPNGKLAAFVSNRQSETMHLYLHESQSIRKISLGNLPVEGFTWSPDSRFIVFSQGIYDNDLWVHDTKTGLTTKLLALHSSEQHVYEEGWGVGGLLVASNHADRYQVGVITHEQIRAVCEGADTLSDPKDIRWLTQADWDVVGAAWYHRELVYVENIDGDHALRVGKNRVLDGGVIGGLKVSGDAIYFTRSTYDRDYELYVVDSSLRVNRLTDSLGSIEAVFTEPKHIEYVSDDLKIHALLYESKGDRAAVYIHGGPDYQSMNSFNPTIQLLVQRGFSVIAPNYRGSTGYGRVFNHLNDGDLGGGDLQDVIQAKRVLGSKRVAVLGASYGGYLTMMCVTKFPDEWCSAVAIVPFVNWFTEKQHEREVLKQYDELKMGSDEQLLRDRSPIYNVDKIRAPLLLLAGENDPRCPAEETIQVVEKLRGLSVKAEYKVYSGEGHGFAKKENWVDSIKRTVEFLDANCT
ncbi:hypothetical protein B9Q09_04305 [Candidatus Marsarchaeota G2 archaeon ECH_B_SAG-C16]|jgi:dipeptidyl aminopeptidase/acylaminoacyl peptidase|uniref:Peptidase S9 prolyl oligopeptidase catalytic domain-containing protein n=2 Tax=Candidatus Marsarchaeota group 2 TaxID=2203771 RepID=A0A2R6CDX9_9ARCH|nr:MAG: hypothetical protein B9Q09_04305 [Candidatus Marsarchaeota G2 archaeon ECH_B_SAG-C16]PSO09099.1 MAG: hypothetical protein B9Q04_02145 [Candidatus Marsarchaeota G2 archaeon BE_D]